jgi:hypothetical protein
MPHLLVSTAAAIVAAIVIGIALSHGAAVDAGDPIAPHVALTAVTTDLAEPAADPSAVDDDPSVSLRPDMTLRNADADEQVRVEEAAARFRRAGLRLPDVEIVFDDDPARCHGHDGLFQQQFTPWRLTICNGAEYVVTHELAHAWEAANLDDADRQAHVASRGLAGWDSTELSWRERGIEDVALIVQQNLMAGTVDVASSRWIERTEVYGQLTGMRSPVLPEPFTGPGLSPVDPI